MTEQDVNVTESPTDQPQPAAPDLEEAEDETVVDVPEEDVTEGPEVKDDEVPQEAQ